ncbi:MAG: ParB/RepB/Spo0J family partition protein [Rhizobiaceae bacterium]
MKAVNALPARVADIGEENPFEPARLLAELVEAAKEEQPNVRAERLALSDITTMPDLFQPRGMDEKHIGDLVRAIRASGDLDPVTVITIGQRAILIDGHHRIEAYQRAGIHVGIPVQYFDGSPQEAVLHAGIANSKAKLPMANRERQDYAWRLVLIGTHSKAEIHEASGISPSQVGNMRVVRRKLGPDAQNYASWWQARLKADGGATEMTEDDREKWKEDMANDFADRLAKTFSSKLSHRPDIAAMALSAYFGRRLPELFKELREFVPADEWGEADDF